MNLIMRSSNEKYYILVIIILNLFLIILSNYRFNDYYTTYGKVNGNEITLEIEAYKFDLIVYKKLIISDVSYDYEIISLTDIYILDELYNQVVIKAKNYKFYKNGIVELQFIGDKTTYIEEISEYIKKGMVGWKN